MSRVLIAAFFALVLGLPVAAFAGECPRCKRAVDPQWRFCPHDGAPIVRKCPACGKDAEPEWRYCPFDGTELAPRTEPAAAPDTPRSREASPEAPSKKDQLETSLDPLATVKSFRRAIAEGERERLLELVDWETFLQAELEGESSEHEGEGIDRGQLLSQLREKILGAWLSPENRKRANTCQFEVASIRIDRNEVAEIAFDVIPGREGKDRETVLFRLTADAGGRWRIRGISLVNAR